MKGEMRSREALVSLGIREPRDLAAWARKRGLLGAYLIFNPAVKALPACWQVVRPGYKTNPDAPAWQRGNKTFQVHSIPEKARAEQAARAWASANLNCPSWVRIEGLGGALFPEAVVEELALYLPDLVIFRQRQQRQQRQHSKARLTPSN